MFNVSAMVNSNTICLYANENNMDMVASLLDMFTKRPEDIPYTLCKGGVA